MSYTTIIIDATMCLLWIVTYALVLIGTIRYRFPLMEPMAQAIMAPFEFAAWLLFILNRQSGSIYSLVAYSCWALIEILIIVVAIKNGYIPQERIVWYLIKTVILTLVMFDLAVRQNHMLFFSHFQTIVAEVIWLRFVQKNDYPVRPIALAVFITKFVADAIAVFVYFGKGSCIINILCITLPVLDAFFIVAYIIKVCKIKRILERKLIN